LPVPELGDTVTQEASDEIAHDVFDVTKRTADPPVALGTCQVDNPRDSAGLGAAAG